MRENGAKRRLQHLVDNGFSESTVIWIEMIVIELFQASLRLHKKLRQMQQAAFKQSVRVG